MTRQHAVSFVSGLLFAVGLGLSGMTQPAKIIGFLDVFGAWDPTLAFVMVGAIAVHLIPASRVRRSGTRPFLAERFNLPTNTKVDARLVTGALLFGIGWGAAGFCPGPAMVSLVTLTPTTLLFVASMLAGMFVHALVFERHEPTRMTPTAASPSSIDAAAD